MFVYLATRHVEGSDFLQDCWTLCCTIDLWCIFLALYIVCFFMCQNFGCLISIRSSYGTLWSPNEKKTWRHPEDNGIITGCMYGNESTENRPQTGAEMGPVRKLWASSERLARVRWGAGPRELSSHFIFRAKNAMICARKRSWFSIPLSPDKVWLFHTLFSKKIFINFEPFIARETITLSWEIRNIFLNLYRYVYRILFRTIFFGPAAVLANSREMRNGHGVQKSFKPSKLWNRELQKTSHS